MTKRKTTPATDEAPAPALTDKSGGVHYPYSEGGPTFATVCGSDGQPWPCDVAAGEGYQAAPVPELVETVGASIEGTGAHTVTVSGSATVDELVAAGISAETAQAIHAAETSDSGHGGDGGTA